MQNHKIEKKSWCSTQRHTQCAKSTEQTTISIINCPNVELQKTTNKSNLHNAITPCIAKLTCNKRNKLATQQSANEKRVQCVTRGLLFLLVHIFQN